MARRLGGGTFAQALAALAAVVSPMYLIFASAYSMNHFDLLFWTLGAYVILGILKNDDPKGWLLFGLIAGLGLQNKLSMGFLGFGLCVALVLTRNRKYIVSKVDGKFRPGLYLWGGGALAVLIFCPYLIWQALNDWPTIEWVGKSNAAYGASPLEFLVGQVGHPFTLPHLARGPLLLPVQPPRQSLPHDGHHLRERFHPARDAERKILLPCGCISRCSSLAGRYSSSPSPSTGTGVPSNGHRNSPWW